jgi:transcriptional regulator GlxA family with amidase domain
MPKKPATSSPSLLDVAIVVFDGVNAFELGVASEVFANASMVETRNPWYRFSVCGAGPVTTDAGFSVVPPHGLARISRATTLIVPPATDLSLVPETVFSAVRRAHARGCRIVSLCTGALILAEAGLLDGRRATTHWEDCEELARRYPKVRVDSAVLYVDEGDVMTSAGSAASLDLLLHLVRQDLGSETATRLARALVVAPQRAGGQAQFIESPLATVEADHLFADTFAWAQEHVHEALTVRDLARRSAMSPRTFARRFVASTGTTPHQWIQHQRVHLAQQLLETSDLSIDQVAERSGLGSADNLRQHFGRILLTTPQAYRRAFQARLTV